jgi:hypothetical protein
MQKISPLTNDVRKVMEPQPHSLRHGKTNNLPMIIFCFVIVLAGIGTGWSLSKSPAEVNNQQISPSGTSENATEAGVKDVSGFDAQVEGSLEEGGINGEGTYHLVRDGGKSQYVYLTSSAIDLSKFTGKKVKVWGTTISAKSAPWLVDAGRIQVTQ